MTNTNTGENTTDDQIAALRGEAGTAGDHAQALICDIALGTVDSNDGYEHLRIWSFLSTDDKHRIRQLDAQTARDICIGVITEGK